MPHDSDRRRAYDRARDSFNDLPPEDQARFLFETTVSALARGAKNASRVLATELEHLFGNASRADRTHAQSSSDPASSEGQAGNDTQPPDRSQSSPGPAEPPTDAQRPPGER